MSKRCRESSVANDRTTHPATQRCELFSHTLEPSRCRRLFGSLDGTLLDLRPLTQAGLIVQARLETLTKACGCMKGQTWCLNFTPPPPPPPAPPPASHSPNGTSPTHQKVQERDKKSKQASCSRHLRKAAPVHMRHDSREEAP